DPRCRHASRRRRSSWAGAYAAGWRGRAGARGDLRPVLGGEHPPQVLGAPDPRRPVETAELHHVAPAGRAAEDPPHAAEPPHAPPPFPHRDDPTAERHVELRDVLAEAAPPPSGTPGDVSIEHHGELLDQRAAARRGPHCPTITAAR